MTAPLPPEQDTAPTCYRHADRETWVRCTRCDRPICPECMVPASVGFQCPDDVREGSRGVRAPRTAFGARLSDGSAALTKALIAANVAVFAIGLAVGQAEVQRRFGAHGFSVAGGETYRMLTAAFVHAGVFHLLMNMLALASVGPALEQVLGRARFAALYGLSALGGSVASYWISHPNQLGVGASGAVFGVFGAWFVVARRLGGDTSSILGVLAVNVVIGFVPGLNIDWRAHLGGLVVGAAVAALMAYAPRDRRTLVQAGGCVALLVVLVALTAARTAQLREQFVGFVLSAV